MRVVLLTDQGKLGKRGEIVEIEPGYAINYLLPRGLALEVKSGDIKLFEQQREKIDARHVREREAAANIATQLAKLRLRMLRPSGEDGRPVDTVTVQEIAESLQLLGFAIDRRRIVPAGGLKDFGNYSVRIELHPEVIAEVAISIVSEDQHQFEEALARAVDAIGANLNRSIAALDGIETRLEGVGK